MWGDGGWTAKLKVIKHFVVQGGREDQQGGKRGGLNLFIADKDQFPKRVTSHSKTCVSTFPTK